MATGLQPSINDNEANLLKKIASNYYNFAVNSGATGVNPPNINDTYVILTKKICYASAAALDRLAP